MGLLDGTFMHCPSRVRSPKLTSASPYSPSPQLFHQISTRFSSTVKARRFLSYRTIPLQKRMTPPLLIALPDDFRA